LNDKRFKEHVCYAWEINSLFADVTPRGLTFIGDKLETLLRNYLTNIEHANATIKPVNYIVLTDGHPTDDPEDAIVMAAKRLDKGDFPLTQVGIQFVQIGSDPSATKFLEELDDNLQSKYNIRDMVDTTPFKKIHGRLTAEMLTKILLGGINRRVDRKGGRSV